MRRIIAWTLRAGVTAADLSRTGQRPLETKWAIPCAG